MCHYLSSQDNDQPSEYVSNEYRRGRTKALAANVIAIAIMITVMTTLTSISEHSVNAQMMGDHDRSWAENNVWSKAPTA